MKDTSYKKECRNCEYVMESSCKGCRTFGKKAYENFKLRKELEIAKTIEAKNKEIEQLKADRKEMYKLCYTEAGLTPDCNPYYCVKKLQEDYEVLWNEYLRITTYDPFKKCGILEEVETTTSDGTVLQKDLEEKK